VDRNEAIARLKQHEAELKGARRRTPLSVRLDGARRSDRGFRRRSLLRSQTRQAGAFPVDGGEGDRCQDLGCKTDIMTRASLHQVLRERIEASALLVF
jgi:hypothetical protein